MSKQVNIYKSVFILFNLFYCGNCTQFFISEKQQLCWLFILAWPSMLVLVCFFSQQGLSTLLFTHHCSLAAQLRVKTHNTKRSNNVRVYLTTKLQEQNILFLPGYCPLGANFILHFYNSQNCFFFFPNITDLNFKTQTRSAVSVREGQGVVLLCGTPTYAGGEAREHFQSYTLFYL